MVQYFGQQVATFINHFFEFSGIDKASRHNVRTPHQLARLPVQRNYRHHDAVLGQHASIAQHHSADIANAQPVNIHVSRTNFAIFSRRLCGERKNIPVFQNKSIVLRDAH